MLIGLIGNEEDREAFAFEAQNRHGYHVVYSRGDLAAVQKLGHRCLLFNVQPGDVGYVRDAGTLVFMPDMDRDACRSGDYVMVSGRRDPQFLVRLDDLLWAIQHEAARVPGLCDEALSHPAP